MFAAWSVIAAGLVLTGPQEPIPAPNLLAFNGNVTLVDEARVPAEEAGVVLALEARAGLEVTPETLLAQVDDRQAAAQRKKIVAELAAAQAQADSKIQEEFAVKSAEIARANFTQADEANRKVPGSKPLSEINRLKLEWVRAALQITQAQLDRDVAKYTAESKQAELDAGDVAIARRRIVSPLAGVIRSVAVHRGEWVNPGDEICHVVRLDRLRVKGTAPLAAFSPAELAYRPARVRVRLKHGDELFDGKVVFTEPYIDQGDQFAVWVEVENRQRDGQWLLLDGMIVAVEVDAAAPASPPVRARAASSSRPPVLSGRPE
jgi:multidrug efflux pump subunit AcrA (membrane-fusion protein)